MEMCLTAYCPSIIWDSTYYPLYDLLRILYSSLSVTKYRIQPFYLYFSKDIDILFLLKDIKNVHLLRATKTGTINVVILECSDDKHKLLGVLICTIL